MFSEAETISPVSEFKIRHTEASLHRDQIDQQTIEDVLRYSHIPNKEQAVRDYLDEISDSLKSSSSSSGSLLSWDMDSESINDTPDSIIDKSEMINHDRIIDLAASFEYSDMLDVHEFAEPDEWSVKFWIDMSSIDHQADRELRRGIAGNSMQLDCYQLLNDIAETAYGNDEYSSDFERTKSKDSLYRTQEK